jgi:hypothetical protein
VLLDHRYTLPNGLRVLLRLPHPGDGARLRELHLRVGLPADELDLSRIARFDPRRGVTICATVLVGTKELLVGYATAEVAPSRVAATPTVVVDDRLAPGLGALLTQALHDRLAAARRVA